MAGYDVAFDAALIKRISDAGVSVPTVEMNTQDPVHVMEALKAFECIFGKFICTGDIVILASGGTERHCLTFIRSEEFRREFEVSGTKVNGVATKNPKYIDGTDIHVTSGIFSGICLCTLRSVMLKGEVEAFITAELERLDDYIGDIAAKTEVSDLIVPDEEVYSAPGASKRYSVYIDPDLDSYLEKRSCEIPRTILADGPEAALFDYLESVTDRFWLYAERGDAIAAIPEDSGEPGALYRLAETASVFAGEHEIDGTTVFVTPDPWSESDHMLTVETAEFEGHSVCICDLMPVSVARNRIKGLIDDVRISKADSGD